MTFPPTFINPGKHFLCMVKKPRKSDDQKSVRKPRMESARPSSTFEEFKKTYVPKKSGRGRKFSGDSRGSKFGGGRNFSGGPPRGPRRGSSNRAKYGERRQEKFDVVCDKCGEDCQVPFRPSSSKPVYCDKCYSKSGSSSVDLSEVTNRLDKIEEKVDKILALLNID